MEIKIQGLQAAITAAAVVVLLACFIPGTSGVRCYQCSGSTYYDPSGCFEPNEDSTIANECEKNEWCEKRLTRIDTWQEKVERGCSSNCQGKPYIWTEDFRVHCCKDTDLCNRASSTTLPSLFFMVTLTVMAIIGVKAFN